jgi:hypothetical protein
MPARGLCQSPDYSMSQQTAVWLTSPQAAEYKCFAAYCLAAITKLASGLSATLNTVSDGRNSVPTENRVPQGSSCGTVCRTVFRGPSHGVV